MKRLIIVLALVMSGIVLAGAIVLSYTRKPAPDRPILKVNAAYENRTVIKPSTIPNAGNGLFAAVKIKKGEVIGELGGLMVEEDYNPEDNRYIASIPECAWDKSHPYKSLDSKEHGGKVSRINFAPSQINGRETNFQNAAIQQICESPYVIFVALQDIEPGTEIWSTYGPDYEYDNFMKLPEVRGFFCGLLKVDCSSEFTYAY